MSVLHLGKKNFENEVLKSEIPVLVDFWAEWCGPCKAIAPMVEEIAEEYEGRLTVGKINVDEEQDLAIKFNVMSIPTLFVFKGGKVVDMVVGALPKEKILSKIKPHLL